MFDNFLEYLTYEKRYSHHTVQSYRTDLFQFQAYYKSSFDGEELSKVNHDIVRSWVVFLVESELSSKSINRKLSSLRSFFKWAIRYQGVLNDPTLQISAPKISKRLPVFVEESQIDTLMDSHLFPDTYEGKRDELIIDVFYQLGIRCSELINLRLSNIDLSRKLIKVLGKRNKERLIPIGEDLAHKISGFIDIERRTVDAEKTDFMFLTAKGVKLYPKLVYRVVNTYLGKVSALRKKSPHVLRHTFATHMLNRGADLNAIKELLGHSSLASTQVYTHNSIQQLKEVHRKAHPKG